jgi:omega-amidase
VLAKVVAVQTRIGQRLTLEDKLLIFKQQPDFICLPEYCLINETFQDFSRAALKAKDDIKYLANLSNEFSTCLIGGSVIEADGDSLFNSSYLFNRGMIIGRYRKLNPVSGEIRRGVLPGDRLFTTIIDDIKIAILICADALNKELFNVLSHENIDIIFIPTTSPYRPAESRSEKHKRDNDIYLAGAQASGSYIIKTCAVGNLFGKPLQGRSLIVSPWQIMKRVDSYSEMSPCLLTAVLDIAELREFRQKKKTAKVALSRD